MAQIQEEAIPREVMEGLRERLEGDERIELFVRLLLEENERQNLVSRGEASPARLRQHVLDSASSLFLLEDLPEGSRVADVGSGNGLPGIVLACLAEGLKFSLVESVSRKCRFLERAAQRLALGHVRVLNVRSEELAAEERESFDLALARALAPFEVACELLSPLVKVGGKVVLYKGPGLTEEMEGKLGLASYLGLSAPKVWRYELEGGARYLAVMDKVSPCPVGVPRRPGMAGKRPLRIGKGG